MKKLLALLLALCMVFAMAGCSDTGGASTTTPGGSTAPVGGSGGGIPEDFTIAYAAVTTSLAPWVVEIAKNMQTMCDNNGWTLKAYDGMGDVTTQTEQIDSIISDGEADLVILFAAVAAVGDGYVQKLTDAGIPVITLGSDVTEVGQAMVKCYVGPDQEAMIKYGADYILDTFGKDADLNYVILSGFEGQYDYIVREAAVKGYFEDANYNLLNVGYAGASRAGALELMSNYLSGNSDIDFVFALSDEFALGAIQAIDAANKTGEITVVSVETFIDGLQAIRDGKMALSVTMTGASVVQQAEIAIKAVMNGEAIDYYQASHIEAVTIDNVDSVTVEY